MAPATSLFNTSHDDVPNSLNHDIVQDNHADCSPGPAVHINPIIRAGNKGSQLSMYMYNEPHNLVDKPAHDCNVHSSSILDHVGVDEIHST